MKTITPSSLVAAVEARPVYRQMLGCSVMKDIEDKRLVIHDLAALLNSRLVESENDSELASFARAIIHTVDALEDDLQDLASSAQLYANQH